MLRTGNHVRFVLNLNGLLRFPWINGVKTGHTLDAGYVLVASGTQGGMTLVDAERARHLERGRPRLERARALEWGFANFGCARPCAPAGCSPAVITGEHARTHAAG